MHFLQKKLADRTESLSTGFKFLLTVALMKSYVPKTLLHPSLHNYAIQTHGILYHFVDFCTNTTLCSSTLVYFSFSICYDDFKSILK